jgi:hypothetical protein
MIEMHQIIRRIIRIIDQVKRTQIVNLGKILPEMLQVQDKTPPITDPIQNQEVISEKYYFLKR